MNDQVKAPETQVVNRITTADVLRGASVQKVDRETGELLWANDAKTEPKMGPIDKYIPQDLYIIVGRAREDKPVESQYGDNVEYRGAFEAIRICDGKRFVANRTIFSPPTDGVVRETFLAAKADDPTAEVSFAFVIGTEEHVHAGEKKWRFTCKPLDTGAAVIDPLEQLKAAVSGQMANYLPAPIAAALQLTGPAASDTGGADASAPAKTGKAKGDKPDGGEEKAD